MEKLQELLEYTFYFGEDIKISVKALLILIGVFLLTATILRLFRLLISRRLPPDDGKKFVTVFSFIKYFIFTIVTFVTLDNMGVNVTAVFAASAALLIGIGLAMQTLFQDILSGVFLLLDQSLHVNDVIEIDGKVGRVTSINLRTTKMVTIENKVLVIPNHLHLTNMLYNYTQNDKMTRESINVGVAYGSDVQLVKQILLDVTKSIKGIHQKPEPSVFFYEFGDSSLNFKLVFTVIDSFWSVVPKSELHFEIDKRFRENNITIPFPQRDVHLYSKN